MACLVNAGFIWKRQFLQRHRFYQRNTYEFLFVFNHKRSSETKWDTGQKTTAIFHTPDVHKNTPRNNGCESESDGCATIWCKYIAKKFNLWVGSMSLMPQTDTDYRWENHDNNQTKRSEVQLKVKLGVVIIKSWQAKHIYF